MGKHGIPWPRLIDMSCLCILRGRGRWAYKNGLGMNPLMPGMLLLSLCAHIRIIPCDSFPVAELHLDCAARFEQFLKLWQLSPRPLAPLGSWGTRFSVPSKFLEQDVAGMLADSSIVLFPTVSLGRVLPRWKPANATEEALEIASIGAQYDRTKPEEADCAETAPKYCVLPSREHGVSRYQW
jgi:hypothetical protein